MINFYKLEAVWVIQSSKWNKRFVQKLIKNNPFLQKRNFNNKNKYNKSVTMIVWKEIILHSLINLLSLFKSPRIKNHRQISV